MLIDFSNFFQLLFKIFKYLPLLDRKNAKLVCKLWYDVCNFEYFLERQKFICCGIYPTESILQTLTNSSCAYLNLEFYRVNFCFTSTEYWELLGPKIHALYFVECDMKAEMVKEIIVKCIELKHLTISFERPLLLLQSLLDNVCKQFIKRPKLVSIDMRVINSNGWFSNAILWNLLSIYINIQKFGFTCHSLASVSVSDFKTCKLLSIGPLLKYFLASPNSLEKLDLDVHTKGLQMVSVWPSIIDRLISKCSETVSVSPPIIHRLMFKFSVTRFVHFIRKTYFFYTEFL